MESTPETTSGLLPWIFACSWSHLARAAPSTEALEEVVEKEAAALQDLVAQADTTSSLPAEDASGSASNCTAGPATLCLNNNRFEVTAHFDAGGGNSGTAMVVKVTADTGYLWFFGSSNVEAVVKVLDGCGLGGHYWVFAGGLTNVNVVLTVTDTQTGAKRTYTNPPNTVFKPIQDTNAFSTCP